MTDLDIEFFESILSDKFKIYGSIADFNDYKLVYANQALMDKNGLTSKDFGKPCYEILYGSSAPCSFCRKDTLLTKSPNRWYRYDKDSGQHLAIIDNIFEHNGKMYIAQISIDVTEEIDQIDSLKNSVENNDVILECVNVLFDKYNAANSAEEILKILTHFYGADCAIIFERDYDANISSSAYFYADERSPLYTHDFYISYNFRSNLDWRNLTSKLPHALLTPTEGDIKTFPIKNGIFALKNNENILIAPLNLHGTIVGVAHLYNIKENLEHTNVFEKVSTFLVNMLSLKYSKKELERSVSLLKSKHDRKNLLLECAETLIHDNEISKTMNTLLKTVTEYFDAEHCHIYRKTEKDALVGEFFYHRNPSAYIDHSEFKFSLNVFLEWYNLLQEDNVAYMSCLDDLESVSCKTHEYKILIARDTNSFFLLPLWENKDIKGFLFLINPKSNLHDAALLPTVSNFIVSHLAKNELIKRLETMSFTDALTGLSNRNAYIDYVEKNKNKFIKNLGIIYADANGLKRANDTLGHEFGDIIIKWSGNFFKAYAGSHAFRIGGDEFICFFEHITEKAFNSIVENMEEELKKPGRLHVSLGVSWAESVKDIEEQICITDKEMYDAKQRHYNSQTFDRRSKRDDEVREFKEAILELKKSMDGDFTIPRFE